MLSLNVNIPGASYPIYIGERILESMGTELLKSCPTKRAALVSDENVWKLHGERISAFLNAVGIAFRACIVPAGEHSKSLDMLSQLYSGFFNFGLRRNEPVLAFGGGVVGDLAGFAAASFLRGVDFVQIPTTLLAQTDSSVGGKVAVNIPEGKNLVGSFHQPRMVLADVSWFDTLPPREYACGMAEVIKHAFLGGGELLELLENGVSDRAKMVYLNCRLKAGVVERDATEKGPRMVLNFGHTFGHALERRFNFDTYNHGEAVAIGMLLACRAGIKLGLTAPATYERLKTLLDKASLPTALETPLSEILPFMSGDKKNFGGDITLVLLKKPGEPFIHRLPLSDIEELFL